MASTAKAKAAPSKTTRKQAVSTPKKPTTVAKAAVKKSAPVKPVSKAAPKKAAPKTAPKAASAKAKAPVKAKPAVSKVKKPAVPVKASPAKGSIPKAMPKAPVSKLVKPAAKPAPKPVAKKAMPLPKKAVPALVKKVQPLKKAVVQVTKKVVPTKPTPAKPAPAKAPSAKSAPGKAAPAKTVPAPKGKPTANPAVAKPPTPAPAAPQAKVPSKAVVMPRPNPVMTHAALQSEKRKQVRMRESQKSPKPVVSPKINATTARKYEPEFLKSVLDQPYPSEQTGPTMRYSDADLQEFRELINRKLEEAKKDLAYWQGFITHKDDMSGDEADSRYGGMEEGVSTEREYASQMASRTLDFIEKLENALMRIQNKTYGICRVTGKLIDKARLRAVPHATLSMEAKVAMSKNKG